MQNFSILTRRDFLSHSMKLGLGVALSTLVDIPMVMKRALAEGTIGRNGKKLLFIFLRGANDGLNSLVPIQDPAYQANRPIIYIPKDSPATDYTVTGPCDFPISAAADATFKYAQAIRVGNGFAALHPSLKFLAPVYNAGDLALIDRVGYPHQSRSHFDSQNYGESGTPNNNIVRDGIFYRTMAESGLATTNALTGVSIQSALPLSLRGSAAAMTNLNDPTRYSLLGVPNPAGKSKAVNAIVGANQFPFPEKRNRELLSLQYKNLTDTLTIFSSLDFSDAGNIFVDDANTDGSAIPYHLFPTSDAKNGGGAATKRVVDPNAYGFFTNLKAAALLLNNTDAVIAGTEMGGFDTHNTQGGVTGQHANLQRNIAWAIYGLRKYFMKYAKNVAWKDMVVVTLSEFGRTTVQNTSGGTDHAEGGLMFVAGGSVKGYAKGNASGVFGCSPSDSYNGHSIPWVPGSTGSMFGTSQRYLRRAVDYRSILGKVIRDHLGATQSQLNRIIPGYAIPSENLLAGGISGIDKTPIFGELNVV